MNCNKQTGYMDMQVMPAMIGVVLTLVVAGMITSPGLDLDKDLVKLCIFLLLATAALLYGFAMHLYCLGYPESPFNKHSSPLFMTPLCSGPLAIVAYKFYRTDMLTGAIIYAVLALLVIAAAIGFAMQRAKKEQPAA